MIPAKHKKAAIIIANILNGAGIPWAFVGSFNLAIQGVDIKVGDIDITFHTPDSTKINALFKQYSVDPISYKISEKFKSHYGVFRINKVKVEFMAEVDAWVNGRWEKGNTNFPTVATITFEKTRMHVLPLEAEYKAYQRLGRNEKAALIKKVIDRNFPTNV